MDPGPCARAADLLGQAAKVLPLQCAPLRRYSARRRSIAASLPQGTIMKKQKPRKVRDWNNGTFWALERRIDKALNFNMGKGLHRAACNEDSGYVRAVAQVVYDELHAFADKIDECAAARKRGELPPIE